MAAIAETQEYDSNVEEVGDDRQCEEARWCDQCYPQDVDAEVSGDEDEDAGYYSEDSVS